MNPSKLSFFILALLLSSCSGTGSQGQTESTGANTEMEPTSSMEKALSDTLYTAFGSEPGWKILVTTNRNSTIYDIILDYGSTKLNFTTEEAFANVLSLTSDTSQVAIQIIDEECFDEADRSFNTSISLTYRDYEYTGCGNKNL